LLASCTASYFISFALMENTIMTEKIARRGIKTPHSFEPDILEKINVEQVISDSGLLLNENNSIAEIRTWLHKQHHNSNYYIVITDNNEFKGILSSSNLFNARNDPGHTVGSIIRQKNISIGMNDSLRSAVQIMAIENIDVVPVLSSENNIVGVLSYKDVLRAYKHNLSDHKKSGASISLKRRGLKVLVQGKRLVNLIRNEEK